MFILLHDKLSSCPSLGQIYVRFNAHLFNCCVYPSAPTAFKEGVMVPISSGNEPKLMKNHLHPSNASEHSGVLTQPSKTPMLSLSSILCIYTFVICFFSLFSPNAEKAKVLLSSLDGPDPH